MGFASMFEEIMEKIPNGTQRLLMPQTPRVKPRETQIRVLQPPNTKLYYRPLSEFGDKLSAMLSANGIPSYLITLYIRWIHQLVSEQATIDQIWNEFQRTALPEITEYLIKGDSVTRSYVRWLLQPRFENRRLGEELKLAEQCANSARTKRWNELTGKIQHLVKDRGFGFIQTVENNVYFFHHSELMGVAFGSLRKGAQVEFEVGGRKNGGIQAIKVRLADSYPFTPISSSHSEHSLPRTGGTYAMNKDTSTSNLTDLSGRIINPVRSPSKCSPPRKNMTKQPVIMSCPKCGKDLTLNKRKARMVKRYSKKVNCPVCGLVNPVVRLSPLDKGGCLSMMVVKTPQQLITLHNNGTGFVFNDLRRIRSYRIWGTLHKAGCTWLLKMSSGSNWTDKYWFSTGQEALDWLRHQNDPGGRAWHPCDTCKPSCGRA